MPGRTVVQWDKEDCADLGIIKVDLLGLGMMAVIQDCLSLVTQHYEAPVDLAQLPQDPVVYETLQRADTVGMFPGGEPGADGLFAAQPARQVLRPGGAGSDYPARPHCGQNDASVYAAAAE